MAVAPEEGLVGAVGAGGLGIDLQLVGPGLGERRRAPADAKGDGRGLKKNTSSCGRGNLCLVNYRRRFVEKQTKKLGSIIVKKGGEYFESDRPCY